LQRSFDLNEIKRWRHVNRNSGAIPDIGKYFKPWSNMSALHIFAPLGESMFNKLRVQNKLYAGIVAILALFLLLLVTAYNNFTNLVDANRWDRHTQEVLTAASRLESTSYEIRSQYRGYLLTGDEAFVARMPESETELRDHMRKLRELTADNPPQLERVAKIENMIDSWLKTIVHPMVDKRRALGQGTAAAEQIARDPLMSHVLHHVEDMRTTLDEFEKEENRLLAKRTTAVEALRDTTSNVLIGGGVLAVMLALALAYILARSILRPIENLTNAVTQIAGGNQSARAEVLGQDEIGQVTEQFNRMADTIQQSRLREQQVADDLRAKVDSILAVVLKAASGDLTGRVTVSGNDAIGRLGADQHRSVVHHQGNLGKYLATAESDGGCDARCRIHRHHHRRSPRQPETHGPDHAAYGVGDRLHQCQAGRAVGKGQQHQQRADYHYQSGGPNQYSVAECRH
jgi:methyl-accepting chemotaxis protein WspA